MTPRTLQRLAIGLSTLAGFVDAIGYISLGGLFVAFMSGNSTVLGVSIVQGLGGRTALAAAIVALFVFGVMLGTWLGRPFQDRRAPVILLLMASLLAAAALAGRLGHVTLAGLVAAAAMGAENTTFQKPGQPGIGLTYMTGTLVRLGQKLAEALVGGTWSATLPDTLLWLGMVVGATLGTAAYEALGLEALWLAVATALLMAAWARQAHAAA